MLRYYHCNDYIKKVISDALNCMVDAWDRTSAICLKTLVLEHHFCRAREYNLVIFRINEMNFTCQWNVNSFKSFVSQRHGPVLSKHENRQKRTVHIKPTEETVTVDPRTNHFWLFTQSLLFPDQGPEAFRGLAQHTIIKLSSPYYGRRSLILQYRKRSCRHFTSRKFLSNWVEFVMPASRPNNLFNINTKVRHEWIA